MSPFQATMTTGTVLLITWGLRRLVVHVSTSVRDAQTVENTPCARDARAVQGALTSTERTTRTPSTLRIPRSNSTMPKTGTQGDFTDG